MIPHNHPAPHFDFLYAWYRLRVPSQLIHDINDLSESVQYDPKTQLVRVRCHFMGANYATLVLAKRIVNGELTGYDARMKYPEFIFATVMEHPLYNPHAVENYKKELKEFYERN